LHHGWLTEPALRGEVLVNGLAVGEHYFACSVDDHCQLTTDQPYPGSK